MRHESLIAWQRADDLFIEAHKLATNCFPAEERFEMSSQLRRAAFSVAVNIVEGFARDSVRERLHFLHIAKGSLAEVSYTLHAARRLEYLTDAGYKAIDLQVRQVAKPLFGLIRQCREALRSSEK